MRDLDLDLPEMPGSIPNLSVDQLRRQGTLGTRLPSMPGLSVENYFMGNRQEETTAQMAAMGLAYEQDRQRAIIMRAKARAEERRAQRYAEGRE
jgi:hypothetical protein